VRHFVGIFVGLGVGEGVPGGWLAGRAFDGWSGTFLEEELVEVFHVLPDVFFLRRLLVKDGGLVCDGRRGWFGGSLWYAQGILTFGTFDAFAGIVWGKTDFLAATGAAKLDDRRFLW
jgi:hypothetical protein